MMYASLQTYQTTLINKATWPTPDDLSSDHIYVQLSGVLGFVRFNFYFKGPQGLLTD